MSTPKPVDRPAGLPVPAQEWLLTWARSAIGAALAGARRPSPRLPIPQEVEALGGCFVSLHTRRGELRGCIGTFDAATALFENVADMATAAALRDPRFPPVTPAELQDCVIEISALTPCRPATPDEVVVGRDGLAVARGASRGVLLPQVATEHGWDRETFPGQPCRKAGLSTDAWRDGSVRIETFSAVVFSEGADR